ncbi:MAG: primosomal protein N' [Planctomycetes bacterium]|nr:primosomal protein N' [Planctomycetota bacterium]
MARSIAQVAVNVPLRRLFHYEVPEPLAERIELGHRVLVPFGGRVTTGVCVAFPEASDRPALKPIRRILHPDCRFDAHLLQLTRWIADYYRAGWGEVLEAALPPAIRAGKEERLQVTVSAARTSGELLDESMRLLKRSPHQSRLLAFLARNPGPHRRHELLRSAAATGGALRRLVARGWASDGRARDLSSVASAEALGDLAALSGGAGHELHEDQEAALEAARAALREGAFRVVLLHGVTGSGKTEVYLRALREALAAGRRGLVLVPEISLTPQTVLRFREGLPGEPIAVLHSMLTAVERTREWRHIQEGRARVVIGVRSSIFAPVPDLGLIVVDEEHDGSYKQESSPRYNARDVAVMRSKMLGIPVLLGSATPSLESFHNASAGKYRLVEMPRRVTSHDLPLVSLVTLEPSFYRPDGSGLITDELDRLIRERLARREQVLIFLNRRGFSTYLHCTRCGLVLKCPECDISLTYHKTENLLRCHYCGHARGVPRECPECDAGAIRRSGVGTERIAAEVARRYEEARVARLDRDAVTSHRALRETIARFARGERDILVGTQMVAKGHDFPRVTLVGIVNADTGLHFPDFRAAERTFQIITQVAGRAGRGAREGRVLVQTFFPDHFAVRCAARGEYAEFARKELGHRKTLGYPPYGRLAKVLFQGEDGEQVAREAAAAGEVLREAKGPCKVLGPAPSPIAKIQGRLRHQILLKSPTAAGIHGALDRLEERLPARKGKVDRIVDVDPYTML